MILDSSLFFTGGGAVPGNGDGATDSPTTGTQNSSNVIDLGVVSGIPASAVNGGGARDLGVGDKPALKVAAIVTVAFTAGTSLQLLIQGAPDAGSNTPGTYTTMYSGPVVVEANLVVGARIADIDLPRPVPGQALPRYLRMQFVTVGTHTAGAIEGTMVLDRNDQILGTSGNLSGYPAGVTVAN